ncbi:TIGR04222 domain-containing membrane protein [Kitasatospora gansuensis]
MADTVIARMEQEGRLIVPRSGQATLTDRTSHEPIEADLIRVVGPTGRAHLATLRRAVLTSRHLHRIDRRLTDRGLLHQPRQQRSALRANRLLLGALGVGAALGAVAVTRRLLTPGDGLLPLLAFLVLLPAGLLWQCRTAPAGGGSPGPDTGNWTTCAPAPPARAPHRSARRRTRASNWASPSPSWSCTAPWRTTPPTGRPTSAGPGRRTATSAHRTRAAPTAAVRAAAPAGLRRGRRLTRRRAVHGPNGQSQFGTAVRESFPPTRVPV